MKRCARCRETKEDSAFGLRGGGSHLRQSYCGPCRAAANREWNMRTTYGITSAQYGELLALQGGGCAICGSPPGARMLAVDHDHGCCPGKKSCGRCLRGLLCSRCNLALGKVRDSKQLLRNAIDYLDGGRIDIFLLLGEDR